jgi:AcrR family transcriptional regulator
MIDARKQGAAPDHGGSGGVRDGAGRPGRPPEPQRRPDQSTQDGRARPGAAGRPRRQRREHTRRALFASAQRLWAERGIHGASLDDIAADAGLTKGAVYSNFAGKTDLLLALLDRWTGAGIAAEGGTELLSGAAPGELNGELHGELNDELNGNGDSADVPGSSGERFERVGRAYARRLADENSRLLVLLLVEFWLYGMRDRAAGRRIAGWHAQRRAELAANLHETDGIPAQDRAALAGALDFGLTMQHLLDPDGVPAELYGQGMRLILGKALA